MKAKSVCPKSLFFEAFFDKCTILNTFKAIMLVLC